jgi:Mg/Co/Ni transporter MgtE
MATEVEVMPSAEVAAKIRERIEALDTYTRLAAEERAKLVEAITHLETPSITDETSPTEVVHLNPQKPKRTVSAKARANMKAAQLKRYERERAAATASTLQSTGG